MTTQQVTKYEMVERAMSANPEGGRQVISDYIVNHFKERLPDTTLSNYMSKIRNSTNNGTESEGTRRTRRSNVVSDLTSAELKELNTLIKEEGELSEAIAVFKKVDVMAEKVGGMARLRQGLQWLAEFEGLTWDETEAAPEKATSGRRK